MTYVDGFVLPVPEGRLEDYRKMAQVAGEVWMEHGALAFKECRLEDAVPDMPDDAPKDMIPATFTQMAGLKEGETVMFSFIIFKSRAHRDEVNAKVMADPRLKESCDPNNMPFDCRRMSWGGFEAIVDL